MAEVAATRSASGRVHKDERGAVLAHKLGEARTARPSAPSGSPPRVARWHLHAGRYRAGGRGHGGAPCPRNARSPRSGAAAEGVRAGPRGPRL
jgi:hypothetical protein